MSICYGKAIDPKVVLAQAVANERLQIRISRYEMGRKEGALKELRPHNRYPIIILMNDGRLIEGITFVCRVDELILFEPKGLRIKLSDIAQFEIKY